jgi:hypothetical protein
MNPLPFPSFHAAAFKRACLFLCILKLATNRAQGQDYALTPQHQITILQYAGPNTKPKVPVAMRVMKADLSEKAAHWLAGLYKGNLRSYRFSASEDSIQTLKISTVDSVFDDASASGSVLYVVDADAIFGKASWTTEEKKLAEAFLARARKHPFAVLVTCSGETAWFALAKAGFGIVSLD